MIVAQIAASLAIGMPFPGLTGSGPAIAAADRIEVAGLRAIVSPSAGNQIWLVNSKGYITKSWPKGTSPEEILSWRTGYSLPTGFTAPDPRQIIVPLPQLNAPQSWLDLAASAIKIARSKKLDGADQRGLLVLFLSTYGPADHLYINRLKEAAIAAEKANIGVIALFSGKGETKATIVNFIINRSIDFPCGLDAGNAFADAYRATRTPEAFLLDSKFRVVYTGAIDSSTYGGDAYLKNALNSFATNATIQIPSTRVFGTPIDR